MRVGVIAQRGNDRAASVAQTLHREFADRLDCIVDNSTANSLDIAGTPPEAFDDTDLVVSIGGDGTFLFAARNANATPVLGVNLGEVGFLNAVDPADAVEAVQREVTRFRHTGSVQFRSVPRLQARGDAGQSLPPALNELVVMGTRRGHGHGIDLEVVLDGASYTKTHADGVLLATPTGSTAYNLSEGGPLLQPDSDLLVLTGMETESPVPSLVTDTDSEIEIHVTGGDDAVVVSDGASRVEFSPPARIQLEPTPEPARVAGPDGGFFDALEKIR